MQPQETDFLRVLIPRPLASRWAKNGFRQEDLNELVFWCKAAYMLDNGRSERVSAPFLGKCYGIIKQL
jgi:hypothetical protein